MQTETMHIGRNISRIREFKGMKQETLAAAMGVSQQAISKLEQSEHVDDDRLHLVAEKLGVTVDAIKNFSEESAVNYFNNFHDNSTNHGPFMGHYSVANFNPLDELKKAHDEIKKLHDEKVELYERMLKDKDLMIETLTKQKG
jgi:transcriptional regulator with XRE-family HTH domain